MRNKITGFVVGIVTTGVLLTSCGASQSDPVPPRVVGVEMPGGYTINCVRWYKSISCDFANEYR